MTNMTWSEFRYLKEIKLPHSQLKHYRSFCEKQIDFLLKLKSECDIFHDDIDESIAAWESVMPPLSFSLRAFIDGNGWGGLVSAPHETARRKILSEAGIHEMMHNIDECCALLNARIGSPERDDAWSRDARKGVLSMIKWKKQWRQLLRRYDAEYTTPYSPRPKRKKNKKHSVRRRLRGN